MDGGSLGQALDRIDAALDRIEAAARDSRADDQDGLATRHAELKAVVERSIAAIDSMIGGHG